VALFQRRHRALALTEPGISLRRGRASAGHESQRDGAAAQAIRAPPPALGDHHELVRRPVADPAARRLHPAHPGVDVRITAETRVQDLSATGSTWRSGMVRPRSPAQRGAALR